MDRTDVPSLVQLHQSARGCSLDECEPEQRQSRADRGDEEHERARRLPGRLDSEQAEATENDRLHEGDDEAERDEQEADPEKEPRPLDVHPTRGREDLTPATTPREPQRRDGLPGRAGNSPPDECEQRCECEQGQGRVPEQ